MRYRSRSIDRTWPLNLAIALPSHMKLLTKITGTSVKCLHGTTVVPNLSTLLIDGHKWYLSLHRNNYNFTFLHWNSSLLFRYLALIKGTTASILIVIKLLSILCVGVIIFKTMILMIIMMIMVTMVLNLDLMILMLMILMLIFAQSQISTHVTTLPVDVKCHWSKCIHIIVVSKTWFVGSLWSVDPSQRCKGKFVTIKIYSIPLTSVDI